MTDDRQSPQTVVEALPGSLHERLLARHRAAVESGREPDLTSFTEALPDGRVRTWSQDADGRAVVSITDPQGAGAREQFRQMLADGSFPAELLPKDRLDAAQRAYYGALKGQLANSLLSSKSGTGKTTVAALAAYQWFRRGTTVRLLTYNAMRELFMPTALERDQQTEEGVARQLARPALLVIDDLGFGGNLRVDTTDFEKRILQSVLASREVVQKFTWATSNYTKPDLTRMYGAAVAGRLLPKGHGFVYDFSPVPNYRA